MPASWAALERPSFSLASPRLDLAGGALEAGEGAQELGLAVAGDPGEADDLVRRRPRGRRRSKSEPPQALDAAAPGRPRRRGARLSGKARREFAADDQLQHLLVGHLVDRRRAADLAVAHHGDPVGDPAHLGEPVGDVDRPPRRGRSPAGPARRPCRPSARRAARSARRGSAPSAPAPAPWPARSAAAGRSRGPRGGRRARTSQPTRSSCSRIQQRRPRPPVDDVARRRDRHVLGDGQVEQQRRILVDDRQRRASCATIGVDALDSARRRARSCPRRGRSRRRRPPSASTCRRRSHRAARGPRRGRR